MISKSGSNRVIRILSLIILFFSGTGFRIIPVDGAIVIWFVVILFLNLGNIKKTKGRDILIILIFGAIIYLFSYLKRAQVPYFLFVALCSAYVVLLNYRREDGKDVFFSDIYGLLRFYMYYTLVHIVLLLFGQSLFQSSYVADYYRHVGYLFWFVDGGGPAFLNNYRLCGLAWEPGIWQMYLNLYLLITLRLKKSFKEIGLTVFCVIFTFSTTGLFIMVLIFIINILYFGEFKSLKKIIIPFVILSVFSTLIVGNVRDKIYGNNATSSMVRFGDFYVGTQMILRSPIVGEDPQNTLNTTDRLILSARQDLWDKSLVEGDEDGYMAAEIVNGLMIFLLDFGLPLGLYLLYKASRFNLFEDNKIRNVFLFVILLTLNAEPISRTGFFFFFVFSSIFIGKEQLKSSEIVKDTKIKDKYVSG